MIAGTDAISLCHLTTCGKASIGGRPESCCCSFDESGDPGLKIGAGSSKYFVVALVGFKDHDEALLADDRISLLRTERGLPEDFEFHFNKMNAAYRRMFLEAVARHFFYVGLIIDKAKLTGHELQFNESFYKFACGLILERSKHRLSSATVIIDGSESKNFGRELKTYLVRRLRDDSGTSFIKDVRIQDSRKNNLLQLADMVVGAVARSLSGKRDSREYRSLIAHREVNVEVWPK